MIIADTTVLIDLWRGRSGVKKCLEKLEEETFCISAISIEEIFDGLGYTMEKKGKDFYKKIREQFEKILKDFEIIPLNLAMLKQSGTFRGQFRAKGITLDLGDCIIGATAKAVNAKKIISRNPNHFKEFEIPFESYEFDK